ncbi:SusC/RagA family TonB-linked outer membrane protein [Aestuariibaculum suncheonense]
MAFCSPRLFAQSLQKTNLQGIVTGQDGRPLFGASLISLQDAGIGTSTDIEGNFSIEVEENSNILVSALGYKTQTIMTTSQEVIKINLEVDQSEDEVQVAFRKVKSKDLLGGISYVNMPELVEQNYTTYSLDGLRAFVGGYNGSIWGNGGALVLVDGVPRNAGTVLPIEIDQVTFLKGASAVALYGSRAAKGVIYITTKKGQVQKQEIKVRVDGGMFTPKRYPKYLGSAEYMYYYNQARQNDGLDDLYSYETMYNYASGNSPYRYADVDYFSSDYIKDYFTRYDANLEITGGNEIAKYYTAVNFEHTNDLLDFGEGKKNKTERFNVRGNIDLRINEIISANVGVNAIYYNGRGVNTNYWGSAATLRPYRFTPLLPIDLIEQGDIASETYVNNSNYVIDGKFLLGGTQLDQTNPFAAIYAGGYNTYTNRQFQFNTGVNADLKSILEGLEFKAIFAVDYETSYNQSYNNNYAVYEPSWNTYAGFDQITSLTKYGEDSKSGIQNISNSAYNQTVTFSGQFDYNKTFNNESKLSAMLIATGFQQSQSEVYHRISNANLALQVGYNYKDKLYFDFKEAVVHSARFAEGERTATSPTLSMAWRLSEENFMKDSSVFDDLKLSVSGGILHTDLDVNGYYLYESIYSQTDGAWFSWRDGALTRTTDSRRGENLDLTFIKKKEFNVGLDASLFKKSINFKGSFFINKMEGNVIQASVLYPNYFTTGWPNSSFIPYVNYNDDKRVGFDFDLKFNKKIGSMDWTLGVAGLYYDTKATKRAEMFEDDYQFRQDKPLDAIWGLQNDGFFQDASDIANSPAQSFGQVQPGDIKYKDQNGDGIINAQDEVFLGKAGWSGSPFTFGINLTAKWKNLTFFALATGQTGAYAMKNNSYFWVDAEDKYSEVVRNSWTEETAATATYPRLTTGVSNNNFRSSDFWMYKTDRIDLAKVQVSYNFPKKMFETSFIRELGVYASGANLVTFSRHRDIMELNVGSAPQTRFYNLGIKALF